MQPSRSGASLSCRSQLFVCSPLIAACNTPVPPPGGRRWKFFARHSSDKSRCMPHATHTDPEVEVIVNCLYCLLYNRFKMFQKTEDPLPLTEIIVDIVVRWIGTLEVLLCLFARFRSLHNLSQVRDPKTYGISWPYEVLPSPLAVPCCELILLLILISCLCLMLAVHVVSCFLLPFVFSGRRRHCRRPLPLAFLFLSQIR